VCVVHTSENSMQMKFSNTKKKKPSDPYPHAYIDGSSIVVFSKGYAYPVIIKNDGSMMGGNYTENSYRDGYDRLNGTVKMEYKTS